jgi:hypothetical protein
VGAGALAWTGVGAVILPVAYALETVVHPCQGVESYCWAPLLGGFAAVLFAVGLAVAPLGGLLGGRCAPGAGAAHRSSREQTRRGDNKRPEHAIPHHLLSSK